MPPRKRVRSPSPGPSSPSPDIFRSEKIEDRNSTFVAVFSTSQTAKQLQRLPEFKSATHRIAAWRKQSRQQKLFSNSQPLFDAAYDDDGESKAGWRLKKVLEDMGIEGSVVVARWYGGVMLGPVRFTHIENCAKEAIRSYHAAKDGAEKEEAIKKQKTEAQDERQRLIDHLKERDQYIPVLRQLLADKTAKLNDTDPVPPTPQKPVNYASMPDATLKRLEKARDATIESVLEALNKIDEQLEQKQKAESNVTQDNYGSDVELSEHELDGVDEPEPPKTPPPKDDSVPVSDWTPDWNIFK